MLQIDPGVPGCVGDVDLGDLGQDAGSVPLLLGALAGASLVGLAAWWFTKGGGRAPGLGINDTEREDFVDNQENLYNMQRRSRLSKRNFVRQNRDLIDKVIENANRPRQKQWYDYR
jgi:hypothetical protein